MSRHVSGAPDREPSYRARVQTGAGVGLLLLVAILYLQGRPPDGLALGLILGTAIVLLGIEAGQRLLR